MFSKVFSTLLESLAYNKIPVLGNSKIVGTSRGKYPNLSISKFNFLLEKSKQIFFLTKISFISTILGNSVFYKFYIKYLNS
jgi:hypothetical protein